VGCGLPMVAAMGGLWIGIWRMRWLLALAGVRRSQTRMWLSEQTALSMPSVCGDHWTLYVHECVGRVSSDCCLSGFHILTEPSHEEEANVALDVKFQVTANASLLCS
jgi:hypothetical protein